jgi:hypothetical protein
MRFSLKVIVSLFLFVSITAAQELTREQKLQKIDELNNQIKTLENDVISPSAKDLKQAQKDGFSVFRIMPREKYDRKLTISGGGAYFSFARKTSEYGQGSDIELSQGYLSVGFAGADYGFIYDLGETSLADVSDDSGGVTFLINYKPPTNEPVIRIEQRKDHEYESDGILYKRRLPGIVGHTYILRSILFDRYDVLVALKIHRKDTDGSLVIFWKLIKNFEMPKLERSKIVVNAGETTVDSETANAVQKALIEKSLFNVSVEANNKEVILRGIIPKGKMADAVRIRQETAKRRVRNELAEQ